MNELVTITHRAAVTTSLLVAEMFGKRHDNVVRDIRKLIEDLPPDGLLNFEETTVEDSHGRRQPAFEMTRDGFSLLAMGFTGKKALEFKLRFLNAFNKMEALFVQRHDLEWQSTRHGGKFCHKMLTDVIQEFIEYARKQDSKHADQYFINFTRMIYRELGVQSPTVSKGVTRDFLDVLELTIVSSAEMVCVGAIRGGMATRKHYKEIFQDTKAAVCSYAQTINPARQIANVTKDKPQLET